MGVFSELKNSLTRKMNLTFELATKSLTTQHDQALSIHLNLPDDFDRGKLVYKGSAAVSYSRKTSRGRATYSLVDETSGRNLVTVGSKIFDDSTFAEYPSHPGDFESLSEPNGVEESRERSMELANRRYSLIIRHLAEIAMISTLRHHIESIRHLSPVRDESQRVIVASPPPIDNVGPRGQYALPHLQEMITEYHDRYEFILPHLRRVAGIDNIRFSTSSGYVSRALAKNKTTGAEVLIADYGFGVSQCLPIFVQGAIMPRYTSLMVEQPEAQLHPTSQLELGSFFADLWNSREVGSIIETHSGNILLRLRRLIANGELSHQDVSVAFFTFGGNNNNMPIIKNLDINADASMEAGLPMEFFGADVVEGLQLGAKA